MERWDGVGQQLAMADAAVGCELLRMIEQRLDRDPVDLLGRAVVAPLRGLEAGAQVAPAVLTELFHRAAESLHEPDLPLWFAERADIARLGYVAQLWSHFTTLGEMLDAATRYIPVENSALTVSLDDDGRDAWLTYALVPELALRGGAFMEVVLALGVKGIRTYFGRTWNPLEVSMRHQAPVPSSRMFAYFRSPVVPSAGSYSIRFAARDLGLRRRAREDDTVGRMIKELLDDRRRRSADRFPDQVERLVVRRLRDGDDAGLAAVAAVLAVGDRTLQRRLRDAGTDFATVLATARASIVVSFLREGTDRPVRELTALLGYSAPSAVSRFVRLRFGCDTRHLRDRLIADARP